jgi:hypothetical protein
VTVLGWRARIAADDGLRLQPPAGDAQLFAVEAALGARFRKGCASYIA